MTADTSTRPVLKALGSRLQYGFFALLVRCRLLFLARGLLWLVVFWYSCMPSVRRRAWSYLGRRFPQDGPLRRQMRVFALYLQLGKTLLARMVAGITGQFPVSMAAPEMERIVRKSAGQGIIVLSAHFGGWQLGLAGLEQFGRPVHVVQWASPGESDRHYFERGQGQAFDIIDASNPVTAMMEAATALRRGGIVCLMGDRLAGAETGAKSVAVPFLGGTIRLPVTAYALASMTGARLVRVFSAWEGGSIRLVDAHALDIPQGLPRSKMDSFAPYAREFAAGLEQAVMRHPYQFYNFYDMWE